MLFCEKSSISHKFMPKSEKKKMARGTESDNFFKLSELFNLPLRRDQRINCLYHYLFVSFQEVKV